MKIFKSKQKLQKEILYEKNISFVPTMGSLHKGHEFLIKKSKKIGGKTLVTIFVNPKQFNKKSDYNNYPRNIKNDLILLKRLKVHFVYIPNKREIFSFKPNKNVFLDKVSKKLCGQFRKGHFEGVLDVVNRFLEILNPKRIYLGKKDFQQLYLIKKHIQKRKIKTKVIAYKTIREINGVACSSRNKRLNKKQLRIASQVYKFLFKMKKKSKPNLNILKRKILQFGVNKIDYLEIYNVISFKKNLKLNANTNIFVSYHLGKVRLIDNI